MKTVEIEIEKSNLIDSFASTNFFESWYSFIRELIMNAYDACRMKQALEDSWGTEFLEIEQAETLKAIREPFQGIITVSFDSASRMFSVEDNGFGMNAYDLENFVSKLGASYYTSDDFAVQRVDYNPMSRHGLGLYSCFIAARAVLIESKKDKVINTAWNVMNVQSLEPVMAKWFGGENRIEYVASDRKEVGTKITLPLKQEYAKLINMKFLVDTIRRMTMYQPIPIRVICDGEVKVLGLKHFRWDTPFVDALGVTSIRVENDVLEGYIVVYNSRHKQIDLKSVLFQQNFRVTEDVDSLDLKPHWLSDMAFYLNVKDRILNINMCKNNVVKDEALAQLRQVIGETITSHFSDNPLILGQYLATGKKPMIPAIDRERELVSKLVHVSVYLKGKTVEVPIKTVINGFMGRHIRIASMTKSLFKYYKSGYPFDFDRFDRMYDMVIFETNLNIFKQFLAPYLVNQKYVIGETPGIIYTEMFADFQEGKNPYDYQQSFKLNPKGCDVPSVFCLVSNERISPMELIINPYNRNAQLLIAAREHEKVRMLETQIVENIKRRILSPQRKRWDKIIDFGGAIIDEWDSETSLSLQSVWCLESGFADSLNLLVAEKLSPKEIANYGLAGLYFTDEDFINWWLPPR